MLSCNILSAKKDTSGRCGSSIASQGRVHINGTSTLVREVDGNLCAAISRSLDTDIGRSRSLVLTGFIVSVDEHTRVGGVIADCEVVRLKSATTTKTILVSDGGGRGLVEDTLIKVVGVLDQVVKEGCCSVQRNVRVRKARAIIVASGALDQCKKLESRRQQISETKHVRMLRTPFVVGKVWVEDPP